MPPTSASSMSRWPGGSSPASIPWGATSATRTGIPPKERSKSSAWSKDAHYMQIKTTDREGTFYIPSWSNGAEARFLELRDGGRPGARHRRAAPRGPRDRPERPGSADRHHRGGFQSHSLARADDRLPFGLLRTARPRPGFGRALRRDGLRGDAADPRGRDPPGAGRKARRSRRLDRARKPQAGSRRHGDRARRQRWRSPAWSPGCSTEWRRAIRYRSSWPLPPC